MRRGLTAVVLAALCGCASARAATTLTWTVPIPPVVKVCRSVAVPAYFSPNAGGLWSTASAAAPGVGIMVANIANGPGTATDPAYAAAIAQAQAAGIRVFGYVHTGYGAVPAATVEADIATWRALYGVTSIFLDEASPRRSSLAYYQSLTADVHGQVPGAQTIVNFGTIPAQSEMSAGDIIVTFEGDYTAYGSQRVPSWTAGYAPSRFYNIVYDVPDELSMLSVMREAAAAGVAEVYATDDVLPNPYDTLPAYLSAESAQARGGC